MPPVDAATTDRYGPVIGAAGTTTAVASLSSSYLGPTRGSALASLVAIALAVSFAPASSRKAALS